METLCVQMRVIMLVIIIIILKGCSIMENISVFLRKI